MKLLSKSQMPSVAPFTFIRYIASLFVTVLLFTNGARSEEKMVELKLELPEPRFMGQGPTVKLLNLEKRDTPPPKIMVPEGTTNVARGKKVTSSGPSRLSVNWK